jgi:hypothetical protein
MKSKHLFILFLLVISFQGLQNSRSHITSSTSLKLIPHDTIKINSDSDFLDYDFTGTGTQQDPFIIKGYEIEATGLLAKGIEITFTTLHFVIKDCIIYSDDIGIYVYEIAEGTSKIINNTCIGTSNKGLI